MTRATLDESGAMYDLGRQLYAPHPATPFGFQASLDCLVRLADYTRGCL